MHILQENIKDNRFLRLIEGALKAGYCEEWKYHPTLSGSPQGGGVSPILSNIYMDRLDKYIENTLIPEYTRGERHGGNPAYARLCREAWKQRKKGNLERAKALRKEMQQHTSVDPNDQSYRRLRYERYADDFLLGLLGTRAEAEEIKVKLTECLGTELKLTLSAEKTLITHGVTGRARFLGYELGVMKSQTKHDVLSRRMVNENIGLYIPEDVTQSKRKRYTRDGKAIHRPELQNDREYDIIYRYQGEYRGLVEYYGMAYNLRKLNYLQYTMETSLLKTLAMKNRTTTMKTLKRLKTTIKTPQGPRKCLRLIIPREGKKPLVATFGGLSLARKKDAAVREVAIPTYPRMRSEIVERLLKNTCEVCESQEHIEMHHMRKLASLNKKGKREQPLWMKIMITRKRKSIPLCRKCHMDIHHNRPKSTREGNRRAV